MTVMETVTAIGTAVIAAKVFEAFKKGATIVTEAATAAGKKTATAIAKTFRKGSATSFNREGKYFLINGNTVYA